MYKKICIAIIVVTQLIFINISAQTLEEVIVTATKRETSLQDTPLAITAFTQDDIERAGFENLFEYGSKVPNLGFSNESDGRFNAGTPAIRGVAGGGVPGATGFYIDDIPVPEYMNPRVSDISRIEVLRGPQGTLYGARSMGGTVRLITNQANAEEFEANIHAGISDVSEGGLNWLADASVNVPLIKNKLGLRALAYFAENSGVYEKTLDTNTAGGFVNPTAPLTPFSRKNVDDESYYGGQLALTWHATEILTIKPRLMYQRADAAGLPFSDFTTGNFTQRSYYDIPEDGEEEWWLGSVTFNLDTSYGEVVSTTAKYDRKVTEHESQSEILNFFVGVISPGPIEEVEEDTSIVHETRFVADFGDLPFTDSLAATLGIFYENREHIRHYPLSLWDGLQAVGVPPNVGGGPQAFFNFDDTDTEELAFFGEATIKLTDDVRFTAGVRYSEVDVDYDSVSDGFINGGRTDPPPNKTSESSVNPKFQVEIDVNDDMMLYGTISRGFRIGGSNLPLSPALCGPELAALAAEGITAADTLSYESDSIWSREIGIKSTWLNNRLTVNAAGFSIAWNNVLQIIRFSCGFQFAANGGQARNKGFEVEIEAALMEGLDLSMGLGLTDAKITEGNPALGFAKGDRINQVPEITFNTAIQYTFPLFSNWEGFIRGDYNFYGDSISANNNSFGTAGRVRDSFEILNLRFGTFNTDDWDVSVFFDNVTNEHANLSDNRSIAAEVPGRARIVTNRPRTIGMEFRKRF